MPGKAHRFLTVALNFRESLFVSVNYFVDERRLFVAQLKSQL
jgi:hypothetical protein